MCPCCARCAGRLLPCALLLSWAGHTGTALHFLCPRASHAAAFSPAPLPCFCPQTYRVASCLPTRLRFGLSGTPFQNDYTGGWVGGRAGGWAGGWTPCLFIAVRRLALPAGVTLRP